MSLYSNSKVRPSNVESYRAPAKYRGPKTAYTGDSRAKNKAQHKPARTGPKDPFKMNTGDPYGLRGRMGL